MWVLGVQVLHFQNLYNAEIRNGKDYCCCDISYMVVPCVRDLTDLNVATCTAECEPYFEIRFEVCFADGKCFNMKNETGVMDNILATCISPLLVQHHSNECMIDNIMNVSEKKAILQCIHIQILINELVGYINKLWVLFDRRV